MSSSGGTSSFGVMVSVMESFEGSSSGSFVIEVSSVRKLYALCQLGFVSDLSCKDDAPENGEHCCALLRNSLGMNMLSCQHWYTVSTSSAPPLVEDGDKMHCNLQQESQFECEIQKNRTGVGDRLGLPRLAVV